MKQIKKILESRKIRPSLHRLMVLEYIIRRHNHPTPEDIYNDLLTTIPAISRATVYNTLHLLQENGLVFSITIPGEETRYDYKGDSHAHFYCIHCGALRDIDYKCSCLKKRKIGHNLITEVQVCFRGICENCQKRTK
ncbi:MAG: Fur family transcriptional regulator [Candidatus Sumerlaeota bacterium]|nr:Fur family transcriptional regulator [Candidatus Sumerlaeota bacterium]